GNQTLSVTFTPADAIDSGIATASAPLTVLKATPAITWAAPAPMVYGSALGSTQLNASTTLPGTFVYSPPSGTVPPAGTGQLVTVTFTPDDAANYNPATASVSLDVERATPQIAWATPADILEGAPLGSGQLNATSGVSGTFAYSPSAGVVL